MGVNNNHHGLAFSEQYLDAVNSLGIRDGDNTNQQAELNGCLLLLRLQISIKAFMEESV